MLKKGVIVGSFAFFLILAALLSSCNSSISISPSPIPSATEEVMSTPSSQIEPSSSPNEVYFPKPSSSLYDIESPYASLFDAIIDYYWHDYPNYFILPTFSVWGSYSLGDTQEVYIVDANLWSFGECSASQKSVEYGALRARFKIVLEHADEILTVKSTEEIYDGDLLEECKPILDLYDNLAHERPIESNWSFISLKNVLETYCANCGIEIKFIVNWGDDMIPLEEFIKE